MAKSEESQPRVIARAEGRCNVSGKERTDFVLCVPNNRKEGGKLLQPRQSVAVITRSLGN